MSSCYVCFAGVGSFTATQNGTRYLSEYKRLQAEVDRRCTQDHFYDPRRRMNVSCSDICPPYRTTDVSVRYCFLNCRGKFANDYAFCSRCSMTSLQDGDGNCCRYAEVIVTPCTVVTCVAFVCAVTSLKRKITPPSWRYSQRNK